METQEIAKESARRISGYLGDLGQLFQSFSKNPNMTQTQMQNIGTFGSNGGGHQLFSDSKNFSSSLASDPEFLSEMVECFISLVDNNEMVRRLIIERIRLKFPHLIGFHTKVLSKNINTIKHLLTAVEKNGIDPQSDLPGKLKVQMEEIDTFIEFYKSGLEGDQKEPEISFKPPQKSQKAPLDPLVPKLESLGAKAAKKPPKPLSPYMRFCEKYRAQMFLDNPGIKMTDVAVILAQKWSEVDEETKKAYSKEYMAEKEEYHKKLAEEVKE